MKKILILSCLSIPFEMYSVSNQPNIVFILADDLGYGSLGCYGNDIVKTPNIDKLAKSGVMLTDYHTCPFSTPSRASFLTGRYAHRAEWLDDSELSPVYVEQRKKNMKQRWAWGISKNEVTIAKLLKDAGYRTGLIGKWHLGYDEKFNPINFGFDVFYGHLGGSVDGYTHKAHYGTKSLDWWNQDKLINEEGYSYDLVLEKSKEFINNKNSEKPFFLFLSHPSPHDPFLGRKPRGVKSKVDIYVEMIEELDRCVGEIESTLEKTGYINNTLFIFCSDNGGPGSARSFFKVNGKYRGYKGDVYEGGTRVPFIASFPGVLPEGKVCNDLITIMDWFPTLTNLCGASVPNDLKIDGKDVFKVLQGKKKLKERTVFWEVDGTWAVRKGRWKLVGTRDNKISLYDISIDMCESNDLKNKYPDIVKKMINEYQSWQLECKNDMLN